MGKLDITVEEFFLNYEFGPAFFKRSDNSKKRYLNVMIYEKLLALDGYTQGLHNSPQVRRTLKEIEGDLITEELYKDDVLSKVFVPEEEIFDAIEADRQNLTLKWLFTKSFEEISRQKIWLDNGVPFDSLFSRQISYSVSFDDRFLETTKFKLSINNPQLFRIVDSLKTTKCSAPVLVDDGWYIIKVVNNWTNVIITESDLTKRKENMTRLIRKNRSEKLSDLYVENLMSAQEPTIIRNSFNVLQAFIGQNILPAKKYTEFDLIKGTKLKSENPGILNIKKYRDQKLVKYKTGAVSLGDFIQWYDDRKNYFNFNTSSKQNFFVSLQQTIWQMLRDKLLIQKADERGLTNREIVKKQQKWWEHKIIFSAVKADISASIKVDDGQLMAHYKKNIHTFKNADGKIIPFDKAKNNVRSDFRKQEYMAKMYRRILKLKQKYKITINEELLADIYVDVSNEPKAIDVYSVKTGGILPRPLHPTIDWEWRAWF